VNGKQFFQPSIDGERFSLSVLPFSLTNVPPSFPVKFTWDRAQGNVLTDYARVVKLSYDQGFFCLNQGNQRTNHKTTEREEIEDYSSQIGTYCLTTIRAPKKDTDIVKYYVNL
jgi:hypothetical protein